MTRAELIRAVQSTRISVEQGRRENLQKSLTVTEQKEVDMLTAEARALSKSLREAYMLGPPGNPCPTCGGSGRI